MKQRYFEINEKGHNIRCKLYAPDSQPICHLVLFCHGFGGHKDNRAAEQFAERMLTKHKNAAMVTFNWPAHGDDVKRRITLSDCLTYLEQVTTGLVRKYEPQTLDCYATSFGAYVVLQYLSERGNPFRRIALRCPAINMYESFRSVVLGTGDMEKLKKGKDAAVGFDRKVNIQLSFLRELQEHDLRRLDFLDFAEDMRILHGTADEIVPIEESVSFAENNLIELIPVEGADHRFHDPRKMDAAIKHILDFYAF